MTGRKHPPKAGSGIGPDGSWTPEFDGQRKPFEPGNQLSVKAGDQALIRLKPRAAEIAESLRELLHGCGGYHPSFEAALHACAMAAARVEACEQWLASRTIDDPDARWVDDRASRWMAHFERWLNALGLTPTSAAKLGLTVSRYAWAEERRQDAAVAALIAIGAETEAGRNPEK